jgi:hypothetical protein
MWVSSLSGRIGPGQINHSPPIKQTDRSEEIRASAPGMEQIATRPQTIHTQCTGAALADVPRN